MSEGYQKQLRLISWHGSCRWRRQLTNGTAGRDAIHRFFRSRNAMQAQFALLEYCLIK